MRRVRTKSPKGKMSRRTKMRRGSGQLLRGVFKRNDRVTDGNWRDSRYLPAFAACHRTQSSNTSAKNDPEPAHASPHRASLDPNLVNRKKEQGEGATMGRKEAGNCRIRENAAAERSRIIPACLQPANARCRHRATGCTRKRPAVAPYRCRAVRSAPAYGPGGHGEWSAAVAPGLYRK
jgi:hypothetical protein